MGLVGGNRESGVKRAEPRTRAHRVELQFESDLPAVKVDQASLVEVVYVLLDNAAKYSEPGSLITIEAEKGPDNEVHLVVEDEGPGIPKELRNRVFDKFFQATRGRNDGEPNGTGMGLAIAQGIVEAHEGRIWIEDGVRSNGTRVVVSLTAEPHSGPASAVEAETDES